MVRPRPANERRRAASLNSWMRDDIAPAKGEVLQTDASNESVRDEHGNASGVWWVPK